MIFFYLEKTINIAVVGNALGKWVFLLFPEPQLFGRFWPFSEAEVKFSGFQILVKKQFLNETQSKLLRKRNFSRAFVLIKDVRQVGDWFWSFFGVFELWTNFLAVFKYRSEKRKK